MINKGKDIHVNPYCPSLLQLSRIYIASCI